MWRAAANISGKKTSLRGWVLEQQVDPFFPMAVILARNDDLRWSVCSDSSATQARSDAVPPLEQRR